MTRIGRYWIFFVIVAVGLALSWGQVGRKTQRVLEDKPVLLLTSEKDCRARVAPCAALGSDRAVVLGPAEDGGLLIKQTGFDLDQLLDVNVRLSAADGSGLGDQRLSPDDSVWRVTATPGAVTVRLELVEAGLVTVAEFRL